LLVFFPLLVAGPIERATHLLPQIKRERVFDYDNAICGLRQILWGLVKKVVIADQLSEYANEIFDNYSQYNGSALIIGAIYFAFQIYCDFSGYSDIALGTAKLFGIELLRNFAFPYFSRDIAEFWRRWHISLSSWFRDYLYFPMGGSRVGIKRRILNTFVIFLVSGFWHGANWTFIFWGGLNAIYFLPLLLSNNNRNNLDIVASGRLLPSFREFIQVMLTFFLTVIAWVFFRSVNLTSAFNYLHGMFNISLFAFPNIAGIGGLFKSALLLVFFILIEWFGRESSFGIEHFGLKWKKGFRWVFYYLLIGLVIFYSAEEQQFIYFQF
jgi:alginate O-acetyltransferase complex protein AlgI